MKKISRLAIANRGEVAVRIIRACRELGIRSILLHSEADKKSVAYRMADETVFIGPSPVSESYLNIRANIEGALSAKADAIHPGFGFLSENADFARAVETAGMIFVGPRPETIKALGDKIEAKKLILKANVPTVPGYMGENQEIDHLIAEAKKIGFPVIVKAAAGGGGRGMKVIGSIEEAKELIESAQREGLSAFGSSKVFLEKYLDKAKHIEFQVFGDHLGNVVHLFERECSVQRRHQKIIEESLSSSLTSELREQMGEAARQLAKAANYRGAGTVEFLVQDGKFYFLEMNTRLQVEHPVTEMVLGVDLVRAQIQTAEGSFIIWKQEELIPRGHAIECRIYAEDPYNSGMPSTGKLGQMRWAWDTGRRFEVGFEPGDEITSHYDSMIAKIIVWDETRERAIGKMLQTLSESFVFGVKLNFPFLKAILRHPEFIDGRFTTQFIGQHFPNGLAPKEPTAKQLAAGEQAKLKLNTAQDVSRQPPTSHPWLKSWSNI